MKRTIGIIIALLVLALAVGIGWQRRNPAQVRLLRATEEIVFADVDSAVRLLAQVDTTRLTEDSQMLYDLLRALVHEERWYLHYADTSSLLSISTRIVSFGTYNKSTNEKRMETKETLEWIFKRKVDYLKADDKAFPDDSTLLRVYHYYERASLGGTNDDKEALRNFGRICFVLSRHHEDMVPQLQADKLFHLAIHCAENCDDHALSYRAFGRYAWYLNFTRPDSPILKGWCLRQALEYYRQSHGPALWLLTLLNDYGGAVLHRAPFDLHHFPSLIRITNTVSTHLDGQPSAAVCDSVFRCIDSLKAIPAPNFSYSPIALRPTVGDRTGETYSYSTSVYVFEENYEREKQWYAEHGNHNKDIFTSDEQNVAQSFLVDRDTYLSPGYVMKAAKSQKRLQSAVIIILVLCLFIAMLLFWNWWNRVRRRQEKEREEHQREAEQLAERLRQKDTLIAALRGHIMDKSEILEMLEPTAGKRTIINARNWQEIEVTLDTVDDSFVSRLRTQYPQFSEDDIRLCMLTRLRLSNTALSAIYVISVSAVQHRKQKLKKEGFGVTDPNITLDRVIAIF